MSAKNKVKCLEYGSLDSSTITMGTWSPISSSITEPCFLIRIINASNAPLAISYDGDTYNDLVLANSTLQISFTTNSAYNSTASFSKGTTIYATKLTGDAATGNIYFTGYYQPSE